MATQDDKNIKPTATPATTTPTHQDSTSAGTPVPKPYDPVGMAGKKAGIVHEIADELEQEDPATENNNEPLPPQGQDT